MNPPDTAQRCAAQLPRGCLADHEPVFREPWQAQVFALAVHLIEQGRLDWSQWADTLGQEIATAGEHGIPEDGSAYYELWLRALERLVERAGLVEGAILESLAEAWRQAYRDTPHGQPVTLENTAESR